MFKWLSGSGRAGGPTASARRVYEVGWFLKNEKAGVIWEAPRPLTHKAPPPTSSKSVEHCPAVIEFDRRHFIIPCPVDLHLRITTQDGKIQVTNVDGPMGGVRPGSLPQIMTFMPQSEWRHPSRPMLQLATPYIFVADDPIYVNQFPPYLHYPRHPWPGIQICGRFPIDVWPRLHMWALEWHDISRDLILKRGDPWFYVRFETPNPAAQIRLVEAERTPELLSYVDQITDVTNFVNQSFQLFETARKRRPARLLIPKSRGSGA
ncbi:MAG: hypothetical protein D6773_14470 [Alphaproteobacteria bacterium]|nr:MAG: hypothetical protein D6773_14470 [Alphaproteobacteria bacterium]